jgi:hypothetical protein
MVLDGNAGRELRPAIVADGTPVRMPFALKRARTGRLAGIAAIGRQ